MEKLSGRDTAAADESGRFSAIPSDFKLSYGNHEEYDKGLSALVGAPVANAGKLEEALQEEHAMDEPFMIWSNQFKIMYRCVPALEYSYCQGAARAGGHEQYHQAVICSRASG